MIERERDCEPVPHDLEHFVQPRKALTWQWIGHGPWLQIRVSALCGHDLPPLRGCTTLRTRLVKPAPHDLVHVDQRPKPRTRQFTGQLCLLQSRVSELCGHALQP